MKFSEETRKKISLSLTGKKQSEETKVKRSVSLKAAYDSGRRNPWNKGVKASEKTRKKMSESAKGKVIGIEHRKNLSLALKGNKNCKGREYTKELREKISHSEKGKVVSLETRKKQSEIRIGKYTGEKSNLWKGGISYSPYSVDWTKTLKRSIRERDKYTCQICSASQGDRAHDVHHIDYNKKNCNPKNLITLCHSCHLKTNHHRDYWIEYFRKFYGEK